MLTRPWRTIETEHGKVEIYGNGHIRDILSIYDLQDENLEIPDWIDPNEYDDGWSFFVYKGDVYCLNDILCVRSTWNAPCPDWQKGFDGITNDSFFSGVLVKYAENEWTCETGVKVYTFIAS